MLKSKNISYICTAEFIDRLVIITDYTEVFIFRGQQAYKFKLCSIGILILIHHDISETFLIVFQNISAVLKKLYGLYDQIIKIQRIISAQSSLIFPIYLSNLLFNKVLTCIQFHLIRCDQFIFCMGNLFQKRTFLCFLGVNIQFSAYFFHQSFLIFCVINSKSGIIPKTVNITTQNTHTGRMECGNPYALGTKSHYFIYTFSHLTGCFICKCDSQNVPGIDSLFIYQVSNAVGKYSCLSRTRSRKDQQWTFCMVNGFLLLRI